MSNQISQQLNSPAVHASFSKVLGEKSNQFVASVISAVQANPKLKTCNFESLMGSAMTAASLDLPVTPELGFAYLVPFKDQVQFQIGYKGLIQLAMRSGLFQKINVCPVYDNDTDDQVMTRLTAVIADQKKPEGKIIAYAGYFLLLNGFERTSHMCVEELQEYAKAHFESPSIKTALKLLLSYAPLDVNGELQKAIIEDQKVNQELESCREPVLAASDEDLCTCPKRH